MRFEQPGVVAQLNLQSLLVNMNKRKWGSDGEVVELFQSRSKLEPPGECRHYTDGAQVPKKIRNYYFQRYDIWSKYAMGIWMTPDAWYGVTPEPIANVISKHVAAAAPASKRVIIDVFAGAGGNAIAFAKSDRWDRVIAIEKDMWTFRCLRHNAAVYGVEQKITWICADSFEWLRNHSTEWRERAVIFASPPWGGPKYKADGVFDLSKMEPYNLQHLLEAFREVTQDFVLYLPRTSDIRQIAEFAPEGEIVPLIHYCMNGFSKALCAYFGDLPVLVNGSVQQRIPVITEQATPNHKETPAQQSEQPMEEVQSKSDTQRSNHDANRKPRQATVEDGDDEFKFPTIAIFETAQEVSSASSSSSQVQA